MSAWAICLGLGGLIGLGLWRARRWRQALRLIGLCLLWPLALVKRFQRAWAPSGAEVQGPIEHEFAVAMADLMAPHALADVEARAVVHDPLGAAPLEPFGHLFMRWRAFKRRAPEGAELWSFDAVWDAGWGSMRRQAGYAWVKHQAVVGFVVIESRPVRREELMPPRSGALAVKS